MKRSENWQTKGVISSTGHTKVMNTFSYGQALDSGRTNREVALLLAREEKCIRLPNELRTDQLPEQHRAGELGPQLRS